MALSAGSASASRWRARSIAIRSWSCWTSPTRTSTREGEQALAQAIVGVRARGGIAIVIAHRPSALAAVDQVLVLAEGGVKAFGPKDEVLRNLAPVSRPSPAAQARSRSGAPDEHVSIGDAVAPSAATSLGGTGWRASWPSGSAAGRPRPKSPAR